MKLLFDSDEEADDFFRDVIRRLYGASGVTRGINGELAETLDKHADWLCQEFFRHHRASMEAACAPPVPAPPPAPPKPVPRRRKADEPQLIQ